MSDKMIITPAIKDALKKSFTLEAELEMLITRYSRLAGIDLKGINIKKHSDIDSDDMAWYDVNLDIDYDSEVFQKE